MKNILLITTGGTIASTETDEGLAPSLSTEIFFKNINTKNNFKFPPDCISLFNIDSTNITVENWQKTAQTVAENIDKYDGFVITHGTDTMAYTAAALSLMLENINKPVIITGSQLPLEVENTDATKNLSDAFTVAISDIKGVYIVFNGKIICGDCGKKLYTENFDAFHSINKDYAGKIVNNEAFIKDEYKKAVNGNFKLKINMEKNIYIHKITPFDNISIMENIINSGIKGLILECYGIGGIPNTKNLNFIPIIEKCVKKNIPVIISTQCIFDGVDISTYEVGVKAEKAGALSSKNYTIEYAALRLMHFLGNNMDLKQY